MAITTNCLMFDNQQLLYDGTGILYNEDPLNPLNLPPTQYSQAFWNCGIDTVTGAAELAQIPNDWK